MASRSLFVNEELEVCRRSKNFRPSKKPTLALKRPKDNEAILIMDPFLKRNRAAIEVAEKLLRLASECVASTRATRPTMKACAEKLWAIRKEMKETMICSSASVSLCSSTTHSFIGRDSDIYALPRIEDDENSTELLSP